jgi:Ca2+/Na+ antiporter
METGTYSLILTGTIKNMEPARMEPISGLDIALFIVVVIIALLIALHARPFGIKKSCTGSTRILPPFGLSGPQPG